MVARRAREAGLLKRMLSEDEVELSRHQGNEEDDADDETGDGESVVAKNERATIRTTCHRHVPTAAFL